MAIRIVDISNGGDFCLWINILKGFYWILRIGLMGEVLKSAKIRLSKSILYVINYWNFFQFFFIEEYQFKSTFFVIDITLFSNMMLNVWYFHIKPILKIQLFPLSTYVDSLAGFFSNFVPSVWKLHNPYCHNV